MDVSIVLHFDQGYIGHPFWPERERLINVQKESGMNRARSEANRAKSLQDYLRVHGMDLDDYSDLERLANRQFYTRADSHGALDGNDPDEIVIPAHQFYGCLAQAADLATSSVRLARPEQLRTVLQVTDLGTGKTQPDGTWERFVVVTAGAGNKLSNQRALRQNTYIEQFDATGRLHFSEDVVAPQRVEDFLRYAGREIGVGASRKLGWGRFVMTGWTELAA
jgi:hypothetical protein